MLWTRAGNLSRPGELPPWWKSRKWKESETLDNACIQKKIILYNVSQPTFPPFLHTSALFNSCTPGQLDSLLLSRYVLCIPTSCFLPFTWYALASNPFCKAKLDASSSINVMVLTQLFPQLVLWVPKPVACPLDLPCISSICIYVLVLL